MDDGSAVGIVMAVKNEGFQPKIRIADRGGQHGDNAFQHIFDADAFLGRCQYDLVRVQAKVGFNLISHPFNFCGRQSQFC